MRAKQILVVRNSPRGNTAGEGGGGEGGGGDGGGGEGGGGEGAVVEIP